jgi:hypothetical protein
VALLHTGHKPTFLQTKFENYHGKLLLYIWLWEITEVPGPIKNQVSRSDM